MNFNKFDYKIEAEVTFTAKESALLIALAKMHYDGVCQEAGLAGGETAKGGWTARVNGFLAQLKLFPDRKATPTTSTVTWPFHNFDLTAKILEQRDLLRYTSKKPEEDLKLADKIADEIHDILKKLNAEYERLNPRPRVLCAKIKVGMKGECVLEDEHKGKCKTAEGVEFEGIDAEILEHPERFNAVGDEE